MIAMPAPEEHVDNETSPVRVAIFTTHPIQYQAPLFRALAQRKELDISVFFGSRHGLDVSLDKDFGARFKWDIPLLDGYPHFFLENVARQPDVARFTGLRLQHVKRTLAAGGFDACLVLGWGTLAHLQFMVAAYRLGIPIYLRGESNLTRSPGSGLRRAMRSYFWLPLRQLVYSLLFRFIDGFLVIGSKNREFYRSFGVPTEKLVWAMYGVENDRFDLPVGDREAARRRIRQRLSVTDDAVVFVSSGKLVTRKRPYDLLEAFAECRTDGTSMHLVFLGDGSERVQIADIIQRRGLEASVTITGFVNQLSLPDWYAASDCLVLPSDNLETWGLVVNEAMASGLPVIVSDAAGCAPDLVLDGENGFTFALGNVKSLAQRMRDVVRAGAARRRAMGAASRRIVSNATYAVFADAFIASLRRDRA
jgi:glycosyltransferase involved in cell wall biosynthesis